MDSRCAARSRWRSAPPAESPRWDGHAGGAGATTAATVPTGRRSGRWGRPSGLSYRHPPAVPSNSQTRSEANATVTTAQQRSGEAPTVRVCSFNSYDDGLSAVTLDRLYAATISTTAWCFFMCCCQARFSPGVSGRGSGVGGSCERRSPIAWSIRSSALSSSHAMDCPP